MINAKLGAPSAVALGQRCARKIDGKASEQNVLVKRKEHGV
jgi:hypothetical protein